MATVRSLLALSLVLSSSVALAAPTALYGVGSGSGTGDSLWIVTNPAGPATEVGSMGISATAVTGLVTDPNDPSLYISDGASVFSVSKATGASTLIGASGLGSIEGLAIDGAGTMWAASGSTLATIAYTTSGVSTFVATLTNFYDDLAIANSDINYSGGTIPAGSLLGIDATGGGSSIYAINTTTFAETLIDSVPLTVGDEALTTDDAGRLLTHNFDRETGGLGGIYETDPLGTSSLLFTTTPAWNGMWFQVGDEEVPTPAPLALLAVAGLLMLRRRTA